MFGDEIAGRLGLVSYVLADMNDIACFGQNDKLDQRLHNEIHECREIDNYAAERLLDGLNLLTKTLIMACDDTECTNWANYILRTFQRCDAMSKLLLCCQLNLYYARMGNVKRCLRLMEFISQLLKPLRGEISLGKVLAIETCVAMLIQTGLSRSADEAYASKGPSHTVFTEFHDLIISNMKELLPLYRPICHMYPSILAIKQRLCGETEKAIETIERGLADNRVTLEQFPEVKAKYFYAGSLAYTDPKRAEELRVKSAKILEKRPVSYPTELGGFAFFKSTKQGDKEEEDKEDDNNMPKIEIGELKI